MARPLRTHVPSGSRRRGALALSAVAAGLMLTATTAGARPIGSFEVGGAIEVEYDQQGGPAVFGDPTAPEADAARGGKFQTFARNAAIYWQPATGAHSVNGAIRDKWTELGSETGTLGYPVTAEQVTPSGSGRFNHFERGSIYWSLGTAAHQVGGPIRDKWAATGWESGPLGYPLTDEAAAKNNGRYNLFTGGAVYYSPSTGAHTVWGALRDDWVRAGAENGRYGLPTSDEYDYQGGKAQDFQGGRITWVP
ncbi:LGFP repeat-containing protein [Nocardia aurea]|uniref:LGFP repeat-containing protein n=1 Tax=Nocardia aurea TaxID=2144174 RepID=UPI0033AFF031